MTPSQTTAVFDQNRDTPEQDRTVPEQDSATPPCPHFGSCGGCQLQHLTYSAQLELKASRLRTLLATTNLALPEIEIHPSPPLGYRNRIRLTLAEVEGQLRAGYLAQAATDAPEPATSFLPITQCPIAAPILWRTTQALLTILNQRPGSGPAQALSNPKFKLDQLELFTTADESALQFTLYLRTAAKALPTPFAQSFNALCESLRTSIPQLTGASIAILPPASTARSRRNESARPGPGWGAPGVLYAVPQVPAINHQPATDSLPPITNWVPRGAFFQANRFLIPELLRLVTADRTGRLAFDLYAGVGLFSRALARSFEQVVAVEIAEPAAAALAATKLPNLHAVKATTLEFLRAAVIDRERPELILLDPPRTGAGTEVCELLARFAAPTLVYISCSPLTLPADLALLTASGYAITELHLVDLFPQTSHIETVTVLTRSSATHAP